MDYIGAYPLLRLPPTAKIIATTPVIEIGKRTLLNYMYTRAEECDNIPYNLQNIETSFAKITKVIYNSPFHMNKEENELEVIPFPSGGYIGGTIWKIKYRFK